MYIVEDDLVAVIPEEEFRQLTDRDHDDLSDPGVVAAAIAAAEETVHTYLARRYALPLDPTDELAMGFLKPMLIDMAWVRLHPRTDMVHVTLQDRVTVHTKKLEQIRDGTMDLPASAALASGPGGGGTSSRWSAAPRKTTGGMP